MALSFQAPLNSTFWTLSRPRGTEIDSLSPLAATIEAMREPFRSARLDVQLPKLNISDDDDDDSSSDEDSDAFSVCTSSPPTSNSSATSISEVTADAAAASATVFRLPSISELGLPVPRLGKVLARRVGGRMPLQRRDIVTQFTIELLNHSAFAPTPAAPRAVASLEFADEHTNEPAAPLPTLASPTLPPVPLLAPMPNPKQEGPYTAAQRALFGHFLESPFAPSARRSTAARDVDPFTRPPTPALARGARILADAPCCCTVCARTAAAEWGPH